MSLNDITREAVLAAVAEFDHLGREAFLRKYGFAEARQFFLVLDGRLYDSKAICGAAHRFASPSAGALSARLFSGGDATVARTLSKLGFDVEKGKRPPKTWLVNTFGKERQNPGSVEYRDELERCYPFTNLVSNSKRMREGDLLVLRDLTSVCGVARVLELTSTPAVLPLRSCPKCGKSGTFKERDVKRPRFRCYKCEFEFDDPLARHVEGVQYVAHYEGAFEPVKVQVDAKRLREACTPYNEQHSIQGIDLDKLGPLGAEVRAGVARLSGKNVDDLLLATAVSPTADPEELERRVRRLAKRGPLPPPPGRKKPNRVAGGGRGGYERDPAVVRWVLDNAKSACEACGEKGPFTTERGDVFLEVHHIVFLSSGGADTIHNAAAVCPNCHRALHHAADRVGRAQKLSGAMRRPLALTAGTA
jgi:hypothetical protein